MVIFLTSLVKKDTHELNSTLPNALCFASLSVNLLYNFKHTIAKDI